MSVNYDKVLTLNTHNANKKYEKVSDVQFHLYYIHTPVAPLLNSTMAYNLAYGNIMITIMSRQPYQLSGLKKGTLC